MGAISDPAYLNGRVAVADIFPGQQITTADLSAGLTDAIPTQLPVSSARSRSRSPAHAASSATSRAVTASTSTSRPAATGGSVLGLLSPNVLVMRAPAAGRNRRPPARCAGRSEARARSGLRNALVPAASGR